MSLRRQQSRFLLLLANLIKFAYSQGYELTGGDLWAKNGHRDGSYHYKRLAADLNLFKDGRYLTASEDYLMLGEYWESLDPECTWGGRWDMETKTEGHQGDGNHFSYGEKK